MNRTLRFTAVAGPVAVLAAGVALLLWTSGAPADANNPRLSVTGAYVREPANPSVAAGYFTVHNDGGQADQLVSVTADAAPTAQMHGETANGAMTSLTAPAIPAHGTLDFTSGGDHLMLLNPRTLVAGDHVRLTLTFAHSAAIVVEAPVIAIDAAAPAS